jgi:hypothetical protein
MNFKEESLMIASQIWCDEKNSGKILDYDLTISIAGRIESWMKVAAEYSNNCDFYRNLLIKCVENLGPFKDKVYICDDGSRSEDILFLNIPIAVLDAVNNTRK